MIGVARPTSQAQSTGDLPSHTAIDQHIVFDIEL